MFTNASQLVTRILPIVLATIVSVSITLEPTDAEAGKGVLVFNTGDAIFEVGPMPEGLAIEDKTLLVGSLCQQYGLFWAAVWTSDCKLVVYSPAQEAYDEFKPEELEVVSKTYKPEDGKRSLWNRFGGILLIVILGGLAIFGMIGGDDDD